MLPDQSRLHDLLVPQGLRNWGDRLPFFQPQYSYIETLTPTTTAAGAANFVNFTSFPAMTFYKDEAWTHLDVDLRITHFTGTAATLITFRPVIDGTFFGNVRFFHNVIGLHLHVSRRVPCVSPKTAQAFRPGKHSLTLQWASADGRIDGNDWCEVVVTEVIPFVVGQNTQFSAT